MLAGATYRNIAKPSALSLNTKEISGLPFPTIQICKPGQNSRRVPMTRNHNFLTPIAFDCDVRSTTNTLNHSFGAHRSGQYLALENELIQNGLRQKGALRVSYV